MNRVNATLLTHRQFIMQFAVDNYDSNNPATKSRWSIATLDAETWLRSTEQGCSN